jgi:cell division protein FtsI/penicillin-binding protein 2
MGYSFRTSMLQVLRAFSGIITGKIYNPSLIKKENNKLIKEANKNIRNEKEVGELILKNKEIE